MQDKVVRSDPKVLSKSDMKSNILKNKVVHPVEMWRNDKGKDKATDLFQHLAGGESQGVTE